VTGGGHARLAHGEVHTHEKAALRAAFSWWTAPSASFLTRGIPVPTGHVPVPTGHGPPAGPDRTPSDDLRPARNRAAGPGL